MTVALYDSQVREVVEDTIGGVKYIIINQSYWYRGDKYTRDQAIADYKKKKGIK